MSSIKDNEFTYEGIVNTSVSNAAQLEAADPSSSYLGQYALISGSLLFQAQVSGWTSIAYEGLPVIKTNVGLYQAMVNANPLMEVAMGTYYLPTFVSGDLSTLTSPSGTVCLISGALLFRYDGTSWTEIPTDNATTFIDVAGYTWDFSNPADISLVSQYGTTYFYPISGHDPHSDEPNATDGHLYTGLSPSGYFVYQYISGLSANASHGWINVYNIKALAADVDNERTQIDGSLKLMLQSLTITTVSALAMKAIGYLYVYGFTLNPFGVYLNQTGQILFQQTSTDGIIIELYVQDTIDPTSVVQFTDIDSNQPYYITANPTVNGIEFCGRYESSIAQGTTLPLTNYPNGDPILDGDIMLTQWPVPLRFSNYYYTWVVLPTNKSFIFRDELAGKVYLVNADVDTQQASPASELVSAIDMKYSYSTYAPGSVPANLLETITRLYKTVIPVGTTGTFDFNPQPPTTAKVSKLFTSAWTVGLPSPWTYTIPSNPSNNTITFNFWEGGTCNTWIYEFEVEGSGSDNMSSSFSTSTVIPDTMTITSGLIPLTTGNGIVWKNLIANSQVVNGQFTPTSTGMYNVIVTLNYQLPVSTSGTLSIPQLVLTDTGLVNEYATEPFPVLSLDTTNLTTTFPIQFAQVVLNYILNVSSLGTTYQLAIQPDQIGDDITLLGDPLSSTFTIIGI